MSGNRKRRTTERARLAFERICSNYTQLSARLAALEAAWTCGRRVELVNWGTHAEFMYVDDLTFQRTDPAQRAPQLDAHWTPQPGVYSPASRVCSDASAPLLVRLLCHYWINDLDVSFLEVGCQYGSSAIVAAQCFQQNGKARHVHAFEPGVAAGLAPQNFRLNGVEDRVIFRRTAVTDRSRPVILFTEMGHSENNRVVNRDLRSETLSYVADGVSLDDYVEANDLAQHLLLEIDTQGGEIEVWAGLRQTIQRRRVMAILEFTPHALATRCDPARWLQGIAETHEILDTGSTTAWSSTGSRACRVYPSSVDSFVARVAASDSGYTDLLLVPHDLPGGEQLIKMLSPADCREIDPLSKRARVDKKCDQSPEVDGTPSSTFTAAGLRQRAAAAIEWCALVGHQRVAFYGAGGHTELLIRVWRELGGPEVAVILDAAGVAAVDYGVPVVRVGDEIHGDIDAIVPSSHRFEDEMRASARRVYPQCDWVYLWKTPDERGGTETPLKG